MPSPIRLLHLKGSYYEMGYAHGLAYAEDIRRYTEDRVELAGSPGWTGHALSRAEALALAEACVAEHEAYAPDLMAEVRGVADATGLSVAELIITNGFTDFIDLVYAQAQAAPLPVPAAADDCTAFIVPDSQSATGRGFYGQTWDMHDTSTEFVLLLRHEPEDAPASLSFSITGCVGMIGMNDAGIAVGINNLMGGDGQIGVTWPFVVRKALQQTDIDAALACITGAKLAGAHNYMLFDKQGRGYNVEAMSTHCEVTPLDGEALIHTNHCLVPPTIERSRPRTPESQAASEARLSKAEALLNQEQVSEADLMALTRADVICVRAQPPLHVESCGAAIMQPATGSFWAVWGLPAENEYERFTI